MPSPRFRRTALALLLAASLAPAQADTLISSGVVIIPGTFVFDFDLGVLDTSAAGDVWWEQFNATSRALQPWSTAQTVNLGLVSFAGLSAASLASLSYGTTPISGGDAGNQLVFGNVFAVKTGAGNFAKAIVAFPRFDSEQNNGLAIYWETYAAPVPERGIW